MNVSVVTLSFLLITGCGRRQPSVDYEAEDSTRISRISLPTVRGLQASRLYATGHNICISWHPITDNQYSASIVASASCTGYAIYRYTDNACIPKMPIAMLQSPALSWLDSNAPTYGTVHYLMRGIFQIKEQTIQGPASMVCVTQK